MSNRVALWVSALFLCVFVRVQAADTQPLAPAPSATVPAAQPAFKPNWATPKDAYLTYIRAEIYHDGKAIQQSVAWEKPEDGELAARLSDELVSARDVRAAYALVAAQFSGDTYVQQTVQVVGAAFDDGERQNADELHKLEDFVARHETKIDGENATLIIPDTAGPSIRLKRIDGNWHLLPKHESVDSAPENEEMRQQMAQSAKVRLYSFKLERDAYASFIIDLKANKFATGKEALDSLGNIPQVVDVKAKAAQTPGK